MVIDKVIKTLLIKLLLYCKHSRIPSLTAGEKWETSHEINLIFNGARGRVIILVAEKKLMNFRKITILIEFPFTLLSNSKHFERVKSKFLFNIVILTPIFAFPPPKLGLYRSWRLNY
jgi:hypothetical protein